MVNLTILDVGHGNCAVLRDDIGVIVIDGGSRQTLRRYLREAKLFSIDDVLISHADADHIGGIVELLLDQDFQLQRLYVNPDAKKHTAIWNQFRMAVTPAMESKRTRLFSLIAQPVQELIRNQINVSILSPIASDALAGVGGTTLKGTSITSNSMSAVVRIVVDGIPKALFTADMNGATLDRLLESGTELASQILVFPHHGGQTGDSDLAQFAERLCKAVQPDLVVFSIDRDKYHNPKPEILSGVRAGCPHTHIACTQLSRNCADVCPSSHSHLSASHAAGKSRNQCCAGTIEFNLSHEILNPSPTLEAHNEFVRINVPQRLCRKDE